MPTYSCQIRYQQSTTGFCLAELAGAHQRVSVLHWPCGSNFVPGVGGLEGWPGGAVGDIHLRRIWEGSRHDFMA